MNTGLEFPRPEKGVAHAHNTALYGYYETADHRWIVVVGEFYISEPWSRISRALSLPADVADDPRFSTIEGLRDNVQETTQIVAEGVAKFTRDEVMTRLETEDILVAPVLDYSEVYQDPQVLHNEMVITSTVPGVGDIKFVGNPIKLSETPGHLRSNPPKLGEHNQEVLSQLGFESQELEDFEARGIIGSENSVEQKSGKQHW